MPGPGDPPDKPGSYRIVLMTTAEGIREDLDEAEKDGYEFRGMNESYAILYKENKGHK